MLTLTIAHGDWGYLTQLEDYSGGKVFEDDACPGHDLAEGLDNTIIPGVPDSILRSPLPAGYGFVRPFDSEDPKEKALEDAWFNDRAKQLDYYVAMLNGSPQPDAAACIYPDRVFVTGEDDDGEELPRHVMLSVLEAISVKSQPLYWEPCQVFHGMHPGAIPKFSRALRQHTDYGPSWFEVMTRMKLKEGYEWDTMGASNPTYGLLYVEEEAAHAK